MRHLISLAMLAFSVFGFAAAPETDWNKVDWKKIQTNLNEENSDDTGVKLLTGKIAPTAEEAQNKIARVKKILHGKTLLCTKENFKHALSLSVVAKNGNDVLRLQSNYGYGTPVISELNVNDGLTSFYFGEEPNDIVIFNTDLDWENESDHPAACEAFSYAAFLKTGDIGIGEWGVKSEKGACCILK